MAGLASLSLVAGLLSAVVSPTAAPAQAANLSAFDPGMIITNEVFTDSSSMSRDAIQAWLVQRGSSCANYTSGGTSYTCIKNYSADYAARTSNSNCAAIAAGDNVSAATIIHRVATACRINPQVLLVLLQKEQGLITNAKSSVAYKWATGYACPDTSACNTKYAGFFNQVYNAGWQFQQWMNPLVRQYMPGKDNTIKYHPSSSCGTTQIYIKNLATAALYMYTPYVPNKAALDAGYGLGNSCSSYGNRNFFQYFTDWFGNPGNLLKNASFSRGTTSWVSGSNGSVALKAVGDSARAESGGYFLEVRSSVSGRRVQQEVSVKPTLGSMYTAGVWVRAARDGAAIDGVLKLWTVGGTRELAQVPFVASSDAWTYVAVDLSINKTGHTRFRLAVELATANETLMIDTATIALDRRQVPRAPIPLEESRVGGGINGGWKYSSSGIKITSLSGQALLGNYRAGIRATSEGAFAGQFVTRSLAPSTSYTFSMWARAAKPGETFEGEIRLAGYGGATNREDFTTSFNVGHEWTFVSVTANLTRTGMKELKVYIDPATLGQTLEYDSISLVPNLATRDASFETGTSAISSTSGGAIAHREAATTHGVTAIDGSSVLRMVPSSGGSSGLSFDAPRRLGIGESNVATAWMRTVDPTDIATGELRLQTRTSSGLLEETSVPFEVGSEWQQIGADLTTTLRGASVLRVSIVMPTGSPEILIDGLVVR